MDTNTQQVMDVFMSRIEKKLESVLDVNSRLMKENIELRRKVKDLEQQSRNPAASLPLPPNVPPRPVFGNTERKKVIMEATRDSTELRFRGNGTYDAKETIKTLGDARFDSETKAWVLTPNKSIEFITQTLKKEFDFQFVENN